MVPVRRLPSALRQLSASLTDILPSVGASLSNALSVRSSPLTDTNKKLSIEESCFIGAG